MKKSLLCLPLLLLFPGMMSSCSLISKTRITYGSYIDTDLRSLTAFSELQTKMEGTEKGENFILATYQEGGVCSCWDNFQTILKKYITEDHLVVYKISNTLFNSTNQSYLTSWGLTRMTTTAPTLAIIKNGKVQKEFIDDNSTFFYKLDDFKASMNKFINLPNYYYVDEDYLDNAIAEEEEVLIHYMWSFCPDCQYCAPSILWPYSNKNAFSLKMYIFDIGSYVFDSEGNFDKSNENYVSLLKKYGLSQEGNAIFGYGRGFVPTTQYYLQGALKDASVYFNDTLAKSDGVWKVSSTYYTETRLLHLSYLNNLTANVLDNLVVDEDDVTISSSDPNVGSWNKDAASLYHDPILRAFLAKYGK